MQASMDPFTFVISCLQNQYHVDNAFKFYQFEIVAWPLLWALCAFDVMLTLVKHFHRQQFWSSELLAGVTFSVKALLSNEVAFSQLGTFDAWDLALGSFSCFTGGEHKISL